MFDGVIDLLRKKNQKSKNLDKTYLKYKSVQVNEQKKKSLMSNHFNRTFEFSTIIDLDSFRAPFE